MSSIQLSFALAVASSVKTVHLLGSWDGYVGQLPLSKDSKSKSGSWKGTFRFQPGTLEAGQRYWYYYIIDGYHISHNAKEKSVTESTTGRELNVLDVPKASKSSSSSSSSSRHSSSHSSSHKSSKSSRSSRSSKLEIPKGRPLSVSQIQAPVPKSPIGSRHILTANYDLDKLSEELAKTSVDDYDDDEYDEADVIYTNGMTFDTSSPLSASDSDLSYSSDESGNSYSANSSMSGYSTPSSDYSSCTCERYGITRKGDRVRIDCGGSRCGEDDSCSSSDEEEAQKQSTRRNGIIIAS